MMLEGGGGESVFSSTFMTKLHFCQLGPSPFESPRGASAWLIGGSSPPNKIWIRRVQKLIIGDTIRKISQYQPQCF